MSVLAPWIARQELDERSLVALPLGRRKLARRWGVLYWRGKRLSLAEETFIGLCRTATQDLPTHLGPAGVTTLAESSEARGSCRFNFRMR